MTVIMGIVAASINRIKITCNLKAPPYIYHSSTKFVSIDDLGHFWLFTKLPAKSSDKYSSLCLPSVFIPPARLDELRAKGVNKIGTRSVRRMRYYECTRVSNPVPSAILSMV